jgi:hypothetical protein
MQVRDEKAVPGRGEKVGIAFGPHLFDAKTKKRRNEKVKKFQRGQIHPRKHENLVPLVV